MATVNEDCELVAIHDAARPCIDADLIERMFRAATQHGAAIPAVPVHSTIKKSSDGNMIEQTVDRSGLYLAQTPQVFQKQLIVDLYAKRGSQNVTDEAQLAELYGVPVALVEGSPLNIKITTKRDLALAGACLEAQPKSHFDAPASSFRRRQSVSVKVLAG